MIKDNNYGEPIVEALSGILRTSNVETTYDDDGILMNLEKSILKMKKEFLI